MMNNMVLCQTASDGMPQAAQPKVNSEKLGLIQEQQVVEDEVI